MHMRLEELEELEGTSHEKLVMKRTCSIAPGPSPGPLVRGVTARPPAYCAWLAPKCCARSCELYNGIAIGLSCASHPASK